MAKRAKVTVRYYKREKCWRVVMAGASGVNWAQKYSAVADGVFWAREAAPSQLYVFNRKGRISERRTYKGDPERRVG